MKRSRVLFALALCLVSLVIVAAACGSDEEAEGTDTTATDETTATGESTEGSETAETAGRDFSTIVLPSGWAMSDAITPEDVAAVTGQAMEYFPEAGSAAQDGRPSAGYLIPGTDGSKIYIEADVTGGQEGFESVKQFGDEASIEDVPNLGDAAYFITFSDTQEGLIVLAGDTVLRIDWNPTVYPDGTTMGPELAQTVLASLFE